MLSKGKDSFEAPNLIVFRKSKTKLLYLCYVQGHKSKRDRLPNGTGSPDVPEEMTPLLAVLV